MVAGPKVIGNKVEGQREKWSSRIAFYFAAIGSAVGFGNVWRFPALSFQYGGGAFFIPYLLALFLIGIPLLVLEIGFGQYFRTGDVGVFGGFHRRLRGVGVSSVACGFMLVTYYSMLIAWVTRAFFSSFNPDSIWLREPENAGEPAVNATEAVDYFMGVVIGDATTDDGQPTRLVGENVGYSFLVWFIVFLCIAFGIKWTGRITYFTMGLPIILLFVFLGRAVSLPGSEIGIHEYIGEWDVSILREQGDVWSTAVAQIFFSIGVTFGIMTAYGSYCPRNDPAFCNSTVVALSNSLFSFISGFAVFAALGYLSQQLNEPVEKLPFAGFSLVFGTWPVILSTLPGGVHWVRLLFFNLFLLGVDSAFSFCEAGVTVILDTKRFENTPKWLCTAAYCLIAWLFSLIYATDSGLSFLDVIDFYINFVMLIVGFFETFAAGWVYGIGDQVKSLGAAPVYCYMFANFGSVALACGIWFGVPPDQGGVWGGFVALIGFYLLVNLVTLFLLKRKKDEEPDKWTWGKILWEVSFKNVFDLKERIEPTIRWIPGLWCFLVKQFIPHLLIILFVNLAQSETADGDPMFSGYGGYDMRPYQALGICTFVFAVFLFGIGMVLPCVYEPFAMPDHHPSMEFIKVSKKKSSQEEESHNEETHNEGHDDLKKDEEDDAAAVLPASSEDNVMVFEDDEKPEEAPEEAKPE